MERVITAPDLDRLLLHFREGWLNASPPTLAVREALDELFASVARLRPLRKDAELKSIWLILPRGAIEDFGDYEDMLSYGEVESYEEYVSEWKRRYPEEKVWRRLLLEEDGNGRFRGVRVDKRFIVSADLAQDPPARDYLEEATIECCGMLAKLAGESMELLVDGLYNDMVASLLPYWRRTGVVPRSAVLSSTSEEGLWGRDEIGDSEINSLRHAVEAGASDSRRIGRLARLTGNDFLRACAAGYAACGYDMCGNDGKELDLVGLYMKYADGRDEGLTGKGNGLCGGPGINLDDPDEWDAWYFDANRRGGHPWEVCRGGNSTHVSLQVCHDKETEWYLRMTGREGEIGGQGGSRGYYYTVGGKAWTRAAESVRFYLALRDAGLPVILDDAEAILARFEGTDLVGIVPRTVAPVYCSDIFPGDLGTILDFINVYDEDMESFGNSITWFPEEPAELEAIDPERHA